MSILDTDLRDKDVAYKTWIDGAYEIDQAITEWHIAKHGHDVPHKHAWNHIYWRLLVERQRWHTLRNMLDDVEPDQPGIVKPPPIIPGPTPIEPTPGPIAVGQPFKIADGPFAARFYGYWSNAWVRQEDNTTFVFAGHKARGPVFYAVKNGRITDMERMAMPYVGETEGWTWTQNGRILLAIGSRYLRVDPFTGHEDVLYDIRDSHPRCFLWQPNASEDEQVFSATVRQMDEPWGDLGALFVRHGNQHFIPKTGRFDECQIEATGRWGIVKETFQRDGKDRLDNLFIDFEHNTKTWMTDEGGAFGHSDFGPGYIIGEDDQIGACKLMYLATKQQRPLLSTWNMGHMSIRAGRWLLSDATGLNLTLLNGSPVVLFHHGINPGSDYDLQVRANLSPCGKRVCFMMRGALYLLEL